RDAVNMLRMFIRRLCDQIFNLVDSKKANNAGHALNLLRPKFREIYLKDTKYNVGGYIDSVLIDSFSNQTILVDYKTSSKFKNKLNDAYTRQLAIYAYLYKDNNG